METEPRDPLDELGYILTLLDQDIVTYNTTEKLVEAIQFELKYNILPQIGNGSNTSLEWTNGTINILISIHVEKEDQYTYSIELTNLPR